jgi:aldehyde dehydrogenase (NAD+)
MAEMLTTITAPNGKQFEQPLGLFINNEFVPSSDSQKLDTINPLSVYQLGNPVVTGMMSG